MSVRAEPAIATAPKTIRRSWLLAGLIFIWISLAQFLRGKATLELPVPEDSVFTAWVGEVADSIRGNRKDGLAFKYFFDPIREFVDGFVTIMREFIAIPNGSSSIPVLGWLGVISVIGFGIVGMILGLLFRSPISAISLGVLWLLIVENLLVAVKSNTEKWLPGSNLSAIAQGGTPTLEYKHALIVGAAYVIVGALVAAGLFKRRDVSN